MSIEIRSLRTLDELHACERLQRDIWGFEDASVVPHHMLITAQKSGGILLGAFEDDELIGFVFSFPGLEDGRLKQCSLMCGVLAHRRYRGVGYELKRAQRRAALDQGLELITWTFDPLQSANAHFNLGKLGAIAKRYERDLYGDIRDELNRGLPTDRFTVEWWTRSPRVRSYVEEIDAAAPRKRARPGELPVVNRTALHQGGLINVEITLRERAQRLCVEIPRDINTLKERDPALARRWRRETREIFEHYFQEGYIASECFAGPPERDEREGSSWYLLERLPLGKLLERERFDPHRAY